MYSFEFPVLQPVEEDPENIWYLSLCSNRACYDIETQGLSIIPMTFPMPGFKEGEVSPDAGRTASGATRGTVSAWIIGFIVLWLAKWLV